MLPFLVVEAKREKGAPGFQSILYQTAFPIRRFLKAQNEIDSRDDAAEPCLVWLLAYQGEQWRLHAGTLHGDKTVSNLSSPTHAWIQLIDQRIYDLWQGTIQSQDGALQLLLILDYLWSWARDVYRTSILDLVRNSLSTFDPVSPVSTERFRHSVSQDTDQMQVDSMAAGSGGQQHPSEEGPAGLSNADNHVFLRWAIGHTESPSWTEIGSIRHASIVAFEFRCYYPVFHDDSWKKVVDSASAETSTEALYANAMTLTAEQLRSLASDWVTYVPFIEGVEPNCYVRVTLFFQTYCDDHTWQIRRALGCILWHLGGDLTTEMCGGEGIKTAILQMQSLRGRDSVWLALRTTTLILTYEESNDGVGRASFKDAGFSEDLKDKFRALSAEVHFDNVVLRHIHLARGLVYIDEQQPAFGQTVHDNVPWESDNKSGHAMLAIRSSQWHESCPKFCLFVLSDVTKDSPGELHALLEEAVSMKNYYGEIGYRWSRRDTQALLQWRKAVAREKTISG
jgi:hypothetical protein